MTTKRDREYRVFRLFEEDRELLRNLGRTLGQSTGSTDRYYAFRYLTPIVEHMKLADIRGRKRQSLRLGIPTELHEAIQKRAEETGQTYTDILLEAARIASSDIDVLREAARITESKDADAE